MTEPQTEPSTPVDAPAAPAASPAAPDAAAPPSASGTPPAAPSAAAAPTPGRWRVTWYIGLSAVLPLAGMAGAMMVATPALKQQLIAATLIYAGLMVAFTGGMRWGVEVARAGRTVPDNGRLLLGGMSVAAAFVVLIAAPMLPAEIGWQIALATLGVVAVLQLLWDIWAGIRGDIPRWMAVFRVVVTALGAGFLSLLWWAANRVDDTPPPPPMGTFAPLPDAALPDTALPGAVPPANAAPATAPPAQGSPVPPADLGTPPVPLPPAGTAPAQPPASSTPLPAAPAPGTSAPGTTAPGNPVTGPATTAPAPAPAPAQQPETRL